MDFSSTEIGLGALVAVMVLEKGGNIFLKLYSSLRKTRTSCPKLDEMEKKMNISEILRMEEVTGIKKDIEYMKEAIESTKDQVGSLSDKMDWLITQVKMGAFNYAKTNDK